MSEVKAYKWMLRKGGKKMRCPKCGEMRFVPYVLTEDGRTVVTDSNGQAIYGRCDREDNCCYHLYPGKDIAPDAVAVPIQHREPIVFREGVVKVTCSDVLFHWAATVLGEARARVLWQAYNVASLNGSTVWWQVDTEGRIKAGKVMEYREDGHRVKDPTRPYAVNWCHRSRLFRGWYDGEELEQCWFGEHLLSRHPEKPVAIVESEKSAVMMAAWSRKFVWLASGGSQGVKSERKAKALEGRDVLLVPDNGKWWEWYNVAKERGWQCLPDFRHPVFEGCDILDMCLDFKRQLDER